MMPTYTDPQSGKKITSERALSDTQLSEAFGGSPQPTPTPARVRSLGEIAKQDFIQPAQTAMQGPNAAIITGSMGAGAPMAAEAIATGGTLGALEAMRRFHDRIQNQSSSGWHAVVDAAKSMNAEDARSIFHQALKGVGTSVVGRMLNRMVFGPLDAERRAAAETLATPGTAPQTTQMPPPTTAQKGQQLQGYLKEALPSLLPKADTAATDAAYNTLRDAHGTAPVDVSTLRAVLDAHRERFEKAGLPVPKSLQSNTLLNEETLDTVLERLSTINQSVGKRIVGGEPGLPGRLGKDAAEAVKSAVGSALGPQESQLLDAAMVARKQQGQVERTIAAFRVHQQEPGVPNGQAILSHLLSPKTKMRLALGPHYDQAVRLATSIARLQRAPEGRKTFQMILESSAGALAGAGVGALAGEPVHGAMLGAAGAEIYGLRRFFGNTTQNKVLTHMVERLSRLRPGSDRFTEMAGRLYLSMQPTTSP